MASIAQRHTFQDPPDDVKAHFQDYPWAIKLFQDPTLQPFVNTSRVVKPANTGDTFLGQTLATEDTIPAWQSFHSEPLPGAQYGEAITIVKIGSGVNGHIDICHGGFVSLLMDEITGMAAESVRPPEKSAMTASLKVDYKRPVPTPTVVLCRAWVQKTEGKKMFCSGTIEDGEGTVLATGEALFIIIPKLPGKVKL